MKLYQLDSKDNPILRPSFVLFMDILGYSAMAQNNEVLFELRKSLIKCGKLIAKRRPGGWEEDYPYNDT